MKTYGFAIVGCGMISEFHAQGLSEVDNAKLVAVSSRTEKNREKLTSQYGCDGYEKLERRLHSAPLALPEDFTRPVVAMTYVGTQLRRRHKLDWL